MKLIAKFSIILLGIALIFGACKQAGQPASEADNGEMIDKAEMEAGLKDFANPLPEPFEVYSMFRITSYNVCYTKLLRNRRVTI